MGMGSRVVSGNGYNDLNRELDEKIASIRKKYMEATDLLNRQERKKNNPKFSNTRAYFNDLDRSDLGISFQKDNFMRGPDYPELKKTISANTEARGLRATSYADFSIPRKPPQQAYMYYNY